MDNNVCFLLGAGVTVEQGLPNWKSLVNGLTEYYKMNVSVSEDNLIESIGVIENKLLMEMESFLSEVNESNIKAKGWARQLIASAVGLYF